MKSFILSVALAAVCITSAVAADDPVAGRYGNTTIVTTATGRVVKIWYEPDHTVTWMTGPITRQGTWAMEGTMMCITLQDPPGGMPAKSCNPYTAHKIGDTWSVNEGPAKLDLQLVAGHQK